MRTLWLGLVLLWVGCRQQGLAGASGDLRADPAQISFGDSWLGGTNARTVHLRNVGSAPLEVAFSAAAPFAVDASAMLQGGETKDVEVRFTPIAKGAAQGTLNLTAMNAKLALPLDGNGIDPPACDSTVCRDAKLDPKTAECVQSPLPDGTQCTDGCITGTCQAGFCQGSPRSCDDGDRCTIDSCTPGVGCVHAADSCVTIEDPCRVGVCDPVLGCVAQPVTDGTTCGDSDCVSAHVCISGSCVERSVPEGAACGATSLCQQPGVCTSQQCVQPMPTTLPHAWVYSAQANHDMNGLVADPFGNFYTTECHVVGMFLEQCEAVSFDSGGAERWRTSFPHTSGNGMGSLRDSLQFAGGKLISTIGPTFVDAFDGTTGAVSWSTDLTGSTFFSTTPGWVDVQAAGFDGAATLVLELQSYDPHGSIGPNLVAGLELSNGQLTHALPLPAQGFTLAIDAASNFYLSHSAGVAPYESRISAFDRNWNLQWQQSIPLNGNWDHDLRATHQGMLFVYSHGDSQLWSTQGTKITIAPPSSFAWPSMVWSDDALFTTYQYCLPGMTCTQWSQFAQAVAVTDNRQLTTRQWDVPLSGWQTSLWLTSRRTALITVATVAGIELDEIRADAQQLMSCPLEFTHGNGAMGAPVLATGQYAMLTSGSDGYQPKLEVWNLPGYQPSATGWVSDRGGPGYDLRER